MQTHRLIRVPMPAPLVREIDAIIASGEGGYRSREEFVREAIEAAVMEIRYGGEVDGDDGEVGRISPVPELDVVDSTRAVVVQDSPGPLARTVLPRPAPQRHFVERTSVIEGGGPQFGLHNRDYPSLWAANRLCDLTAEGPVAFDATLRDLVGQAWDFAEHLKALDGEGVQGKPSALFPTNRDKPQSSEGAFLRFAIGSVSHDDETGTWRAEGPLFDWGVIGLVEAAGSGPKVGITEAGFDLLCDLEGLDVEQPHAEHWALRFLDHLATNAPADRDGFTVVLEGASRMCSRSELIEVVQARWSERSTVEASTNTAGYVARAREWGLLEPRQFQAKYKLTDLGQRLLQRQAS